MRRRGLKVGRVSDPPSGRKGQVEDLPYPAARSLHVVDLHLVPKRLKRVHERQVDRVDLVGVRERLQDVLEQGADLRRGVTARRGA